MPEALVHVGGREAPLEIRINGSDPTFHLGSDAISARALAPIEPVLQDFLDIACTVFAADSGVPRGGATRPQMGRSWRRRFEFEIPVRCPETWQRPDVTEALADAISFLMEDDIAFAFRPMTAAERAAEDRQGFLDLDPNGASFAADRVVLFSGGLDSFAGALETLDTTSENVVLLSHRSAQKVIPRQENLGRYLSERFPGRVHHINVIARRRRSQGVDTTQRSRALVFAALGQAVARTFAARQLGLFENGIIGCNLPISPQVVGTMATRTTHPLALVRLNRVLEQALPDHLPLLNGYQWLTKTEVVERIKRHGGLPMLEQAVSCTSVREQTTLHTHCGACIQCLDRRFAILAAGVGVDDPPERYATEVITGARNGDRSRVMAVEWLRHAMRLEAMDEGAFLSAFGLELSRLLKGYPGQPDEDVLSRLLSLHKRHARAVKEVLKTQVYRHTGDLVGNELPDTSLLRLHLGTGATLAVLDHQAPGRSHPADADDAWDDAWDDDLIPDMDGRLVARFFEEEGRPVVAVDALGRVVGQPAVPAHFLRSAFEKDLTEALAPQRHRYVRDLPAGMSKDSMRKNIERFRRLLAEFHLDLHGKLPDSPLLIEGRQSHGYRLDPTLRIASSDQRS